jgi:hypothetical protein
MDVIATTQPPNIAIASEKMVIIGSMTIDATTRGTTR